MADKPVYRAAFKRDDNGSWFVRVPEVQGAHSHGRTLARARENIREAVALALDVEENAFEIEVALELPDELTELLDCVRVARAQSEESRLRALAVTSTASQFLAEIGLSVRDASELLGLSYQRVQQMRQAPKPPENPAYSQDPGEVMAALVAGARAASPAAKSRAEAG